MRFTSEEKLLLERLNNGEFDGMVGDEKVYTGYKNVYCGKYIKKGIPYSYRESEGGRFFNGKENERFSGKREEEVYDTPELKLLFLQKYGWLIDDPELKAYSAKYK